MTYKRYEKYKDSGVEWIGEIPEDWSCIDFRRYTYLQQGLQIAQEKRFHKYKEGRKVYLTVKFLNSKNQENEIEYIQDASSNVICNKSDVLLGRTGATGKVVTDVEGVFHNNFFKINYDKNKLIREFLVYYLTQNNIQDHFKLVSGTTTIPDLNHGEFLSTKLILPTNINEQKSIVKFLDEKTTEIDSLIKDKEKLIEFLKEKRQAIITEAVTKGLDRNVSMKDSGVEWIGKIPAHWNISRLKHIADIEISNVDKKTVDGEKSVLLCNYTDVYYKNVINSEIEFMKATAKDEQITKFTLKYQDVMITKDSESPLDIGVPAWVQEDLNGVLCGYHMAHIRCRSNALSKYIYYSMLANGIRDQYYSTANGVTRFGLGKDSIRNSIFFIPNMKEQEEIINYLDKKTIEIDSLISDVKVGIKNLKEYKQSLTSEVVTGKINVIV